MFRLNPHCGETLPPGVVNGELHYAERKGLWVKTKLEPQHVEFTWFRGKCELSAELHLMPA